MTGPEHSQLCPIGERYQKYWDKLSLPERQMQIDVEGLYSMDLQEVAMQLARKIEAPLVIDAFCGIGGAAIAFARAGKLRSIHNDASKRKNTYSAFYGVARLAD